MHDVSFERERVGYGDYEEDVDGIYIYKWRKGWDRFTRYFIFDKRLDLVSHNLLVIQFIFEQK